MGNAEEIADAMAHGILTGQYNDHLRRTGYGEKDDGMTELMEDVELRRRLQGIFQRFSIYSAKPRLFGASEQFREQFAEFMAWASSVVKSDYLIQEAIDRDIEDSAMGQSGGDSE